MNNTSCQPSSGHNGTVSDRPSVRPKYIDRHSFKQNASTMNYQCFCLEKQYSPNTETNLIKSPQVQFSLQKAMFPPNLPSITRDLLMENSGAHGFTLDLRPRPHNLNEQHKLPTLQWPQWDGLGAGSPQRVDFWRRQSISKLVL